MLAQLPRYADWGYNELYLHLEDAIEYPSLPSIARSDAYSRRDMAHLVDAAARVGIKVVPIVNLLGHTQYLIKVPELRDLNELRAPDGSPLERGQVCPVDPRTLEVAEKLLNDVRPFCTAGKVHVGLDESFSLGQHPRSRAEIKEIGRAAHFARYIDRLHRLIQPLGLRMGMWADMLYFLPGAVPLLPADVALYEWYYYGFKHRPRVELFNFAETNLGERLSDRGLEYWGCPMNGAFRFEPLPHFSDRLDNIVSWWRRCRQLDAAGILITSWEPSRLAVELTTVIDAAAASLWLDGITDASAMLERGFARVLGKGPRVPTARRSSAGGAPSSKTTSAAGKYDCQFSPAERKNARTAARIALACDRYPFSGYPRWEINLRWDVVSRREPVEPLQTEERFFRNLREGSKTAPEPLRASIALRWYFAVRDVFVRQAQCRASRKAKSRLGGDASPYLAALRVGLRAALAMWARTRDPRAHGPNKLILRADELRLRALRSGEPVLGPCWQLCYRVHNIAPAAQLVAVERQREDGTWETLQACHTIEFQAAAARGRGRFVREHAAPIEWQGDPDAFPPLRIALRGIGQVRLTQVALTDGRTTHAARRRQYIIGQPAPDRGFPQLDWTANRAVTPLRFGCVAAVRPRKEKRPGKNPGREA